MAKDSAGAASKRYGGSAPTTKSAEGSMDKATNEGTGMDRPERHGRELGEMHKRHQTEMTDMQKRQLDEHKSVSSRHLEEMMDTPKSDSSTGTM